MVYYCENCGNNNYFCEIGTQYEHRTDLVKVKRIINTDGDVFEEETFDTIVSEIEEVNGFEHDKIECYECDSESVKWIENDQVEVNKLKNLVKKLN